MVTVTRPANLLTLAQMLPVAQRGGYAVGSFVPRYTPMIRPIPRAGAETQSPVIVQISQKELDRYGISPPEFAAEFYAVLRDDRIAVPVVLHLDHTRDVAVIKDAIAAGFTSVMIDASEQPLSGNTAISAEVVAYAHPRGVSVEAELGKIGTTDFVETESDEELFTDPDEAGRFVQETGVDALAVSVGTAHGVYKVRRPTIDVARLRAIRVRTARPLVLHGGSDVPADVMKGAIELPEGGVSKVNIATDLELALRGALGRAERMTNGECLALPSDRLEGAQAAVQRTVRAKITDFLGSLGQAMDF